MTRAQEIMIVRHPQTEWNAEGRYVGRGDSPRTHAGGEQVRWLHGVIAEWEPEAVFSSPLARALDAARETAPVGVEVSVLEGLVEVDFGVVEGHTYDELVAMGITLDYESGGPVAPEGETGIAFGQRVALAASEIEACGCRAVAFTHGGVMRRLLAHWLMLPVTAAWAFDVPNGAVAVVRVCEGAGVLTALSRPPAGVPRHPTSCRPRRFAKPDGTG